MNSANGIPQRGSQSLFLTLTRASTGEWSEVAKQGKQTGNAAPPLKQEALVQLLTLKVLSCRRLDFLDFRSLQDKKLKCLKVTKEEVQSPTSPDSKNHNDLGDCGPAQTRLVQAASAGQQQSGADSLLIQGLRSVNSALRFARRPAECHLTAARIYPAVRPGFLLLHALKLSKLYCEPQQNLQPPLKSYSHTTLSPVGLVGAGEAKRNTS